MILGTIHGEKWKTFCSKQFLNINPIEYNKTSLPYTFVTCINYVCNIATKVSDIFDSFYDAKLERMLVRKKIIIVKK